MSAAVVDEATFSVSRVIRIDASVKKVWAAVTEPALISQWFGRAVLNGSGAGAIGTLTWDDHGSFPIRVEAIDAPRSITYRWNNDVASGAIPPAIDEVNSTVFTFTLESVGDVTELTVVETGFENTTDALINLEDHRGGWDFELDELAALFA
jgi:uncharacterized protein YndB with AHSA1/START domain